jgi:hypothetical protein
LRNCILSQFNLPFKVVFAQQTTAQINPVP